MKEPLDESSEEEEEQNHVAVTGGPTDYPLKCRSIRIGTHRVYPHAPLTFVPVVLQHDSISFRAPPITGQNQHAFFTLGSEDIQKMYVHFGRCLPIIFIYTSATFGDLVRNALKMTQNQTSYFDPSAKDDKIQKLTFLIETISDDQKSWIRQKFPGDKKVVEIDHKAATEILVRSTPEYFKRSRSYFKRSRSSTTNQMPQLVKVNRSDYQPGKSPKSQEFKADVKKFLLAHSKAENSEPLDENPDEEEMLNLEDEEEQNPVAETGGPTDYPLKCRGIRIGTYRVHPSASNAFVAVALQHDSISFRAPVITDRNQHVCITLGSEDIQKMYVHFGRCLPIIFIYTSATFGDFVRNALKMTPNQTPYFDPSAKDDKTQKLTFLIETISDDQKSWIQQKFPGGKKVVEIDQKTANEILVRSTPEYFKRSRSYFKRSMSSTTNQMQKLVKVNRK